MSMNLDPQAIRVLCFGDSNTFGRDAKQKKETGVKARLPIGVRWTSQLQGLLGNTFEIIEEGLGGRTTDLDDPKEEGKNGLTYLGPCLDSHSPIDLIILMLGTNDLKAVFGRTAAEVAAANRKLISVITEKIPQAKLILVAPILVDETNEAAAENYRGAAEKSKALGIEIEKLANEVGASFVNLATYINPSVYDGIHIDLEDQQKVAELLSVEIKKIYP